MKSNELRRLFLDYFQKHAHTIVPTSSLIPGNDPSLLFTNAGMVQFKDVFLGHEARPYVRAVSAQRCVRAGGKHNDLENVGYTARHHTFFEMLGNFSFGDYFKRDAIFFAWNFITQELKIPKEKLWVTVYVDDDEAADIWLKEIAVDPAHFVRCGEKDNFWSMGDTGPCGPCTEIFYDHGPAIPGGPPGSEDQEGDRYVEIWNLVFMQFNRFADGTMAPLPRPSVDTGMGLERIAAVMQGVHSNYEIDTFRHLIQAVAQLTAEPELAHPTSLRVIADHIRAAAFLITDGVMPSNEGRGYVLRRIIRRAIRHGHKLSLREPFFHKLVASLVAEMGVAYPELVKAQTIVERILKHEETQFAETLDQGMKVLEQSLYKLRDKTIPGETLFLLYDTFGFPPDLTADIARERGLSVDYAAFEIEMEKQRKKSQSASQFAVDYHNVLKIPGETEFTGYDHLSDEAQVVALIQGEKLLESMPAGTEGMVVLDRTPFYAESGGQVGDRGTLFFEGGHFSVVDTQKRGLIFLHRGQVESGVLKVGARVSAEVSAARHAIMLNHSATHLLHAALRRLLGEHIMQKGSLVEADRLRFDFSHFTPLSRDEIKSVERLVNEQIRANLLSHTEFMTPQEAKDQGALALFGEKYGDEVRVLHMGEFSVELCGGTHAASTGEIGLFKIISESGVAAGIRRIEAVTGEAALDWVEQQETDLNAIAELLKISKEDVLNRIRQLLEQNREQEKALNKLRRESIRMQLAEQMAHATRVGEVTILATSVFDADSEMLRQFVDQFKQKFSQGVIILASVADGKIQLVAGVTKSLVAQIAAGDLVSWVAQQVGGKGGGRPDLAQGGGDRVDDLDAALAQVVPWVTGKLQ